MRPPSIGEHAEGTSYIFQRAADSLPVAIASGIADVERADSGISELERECGMTGSNRRAPFGGASPLAGRWNATSPGRQVLFGAVGKNGCNNTRTRHRPEGVSVRFSVREQPRANDDLRLMTIGENRNPLPMNDTQTAQREPPMQDHARRVDSRCIL